MLYTELMPLDIDELIQKSKKPFEPRLSSVECSNQTSPLVTVKEQPQLILDPIWINQIDDIEGPLYERYIKNNPDYKSLYLRQTVANRLYEAASLLPSGLKLVLRAGHRPMTVQRAEFQRMIDKCLQQNPDATPTESLEFARTYVSDPDISLPPHCCGVAVDVDVFDTTQNRLVDFGCPVNTNDQIAALHSDRATTKQYANRMVLLRAMLKAGFAPDYDEWWHFNYGGTAWALFYEKPYSLYGTVEPTF